MLELSACCNLACTTCPREYDYGKAMNKGFMDESLARKIIDEAWPYLDSVGLTGMGETLLYKQLNETVDYIKSKNPGIIISISTNAQVPDFRNQIESLVNKVDTIQISADGLNEVYESIRKKTAFHTFNENVMHAASVCRNSGTDLMLNMVVTRENYQQMPRMIRYAAENGIVYLDFSQFNLAAVTGIDNSYYDFYRSAEFQNVFAETKQTARQYRNVTVNVRSFENSAVKGFRNCPFPWSHFYITWEGFLVPCCAKPFPKEMNFGNAGSGSLIELLNHERFRNFRNLWLENKTLPFCYGCQFTAV